MDRIWVAPPFLEKCQSLGLRSSQDFARFFGMDGVGGKKSVELRPGKIGDVPVFYKQYDYQAGSWRYLGRKSKARREFLSYEMMERIGIRCATRVACGERRDSLGRLQRAFVITVTIPDAMPLPQFLAATRERVDAREVRKSVVLQMAKLAQMAHRGGFAHGDLWVRNILVNWEQGKPKVWWIDSPKGGKYRLLERMFQDLAALDKGGKDIFSCRERARFLKEYLTREDRKRLPRNLALRRKKWAREILKFRRQLEKLAGRK